jgi:hypothetical protein
MYCGSSSRVGSNLYSGVGTFNEVSGCTPDANTQAMLVTRNGSGSIAGKGAAWLAYLNAGGIIITEYSISAQVYNQIYGTNYPLGNSFGGCYDNAMPSVKLNPTNPFWVAHNITPTPANREGCGFDLSNIVSGQSAVTALGGWTAGGTDFACRSQGPGSLNLLEADWSDNEPYFTADSQTFMGALIGGGCASGVLPVTAPVPTLSESSSLALGALLMLAGALYLRRKRS